MDQDDQRLPRHVTISRGRYQCLGIKQIGTAASPARIRHVSPEDAVRHAESGLSFVLLRAAMNLPEPNQAPFANTCIQHGRWNYLFRSFSAAGVLASDVGNDKMNVKGQ